MKICLINKSYSNQTWDGISAYTRHIAKGLSSLGNEVYIITIGNSYAYKKEGQIHIYYVKNYLKIITPIIYSLQALLIFRKLNNRFKIDIIEAPDAGAEGFWTALFYPRKMVTRLHTPLYYCWKLNNQKFTYPRRILNWMEKTQTKRSSLISSPTKILALMVKKLWQIEKKISIIPNPVDLDVRVEKNLMKATPEDYLLYYGLINKIQGSDILIKAFSQISGRFPKLKLYFVGEIEKGFEKFIKENVQNTNNILFTGPKNHKEALDYIVNAKFIILPPLWENFPYKLIEPMVHKKVIIASDSGGFKEIIKDNVNGFLFKNGSANDLTGKIKKVLSFSEEKLIKVGRNAFETVQKFSIKKVSLQTLEFYQQITNEKKS